MVSSARHHPNRSFPSWLGWLSFGLALVTVGGLVVLGVGPIARGQGWLVDGGQPTVDPRVIERLHPQPARLGAGVVDAAPAQSAVPADAERVRQTLSANPPEVPGRYGGAVADLAGGPLAYDLAAEVALVPASTLKVMLAVAALDALGPQHRFSTTVVSPTPDSVVLVGGGDPLLASTTASYEWSSTLTLPTTADLATRTAAELQARGITQVSLGYDDTLFAGAPWHPDWGTADRTYVAPVSALVVDEGAGSPGLDAPSLTAARVFAAQLQAAGITVSGEPTPAAGARGQLIAEVASAPLALLVQELLVHSDNSIAEVLLRHLALAKGQPATFEGGSAAMTASLMSLGLWRDGQRIADGSGLSMNNRMTPAGLVAGLQLAAVRDDLAGVLAGLPVGCATGTLATRFTDARSLPARGQVRAKTGTLDQTSGLAGYTPTVDGGLVAFAFIGNDLPTDGDVRAWFDHVAAALAGCDCVA